MIPQGYTRTIRIDVQYNGACYSGWQRQENAPTVQERLEKALSKVADEPITLIGASRTDAGVHAVQQVASFSLKASKTPSDAFLAGTNTLLPQDIRVYRSEEVDLHFHAIRDALEKTYRYFLYVSRQPSVFAQPYSWHVFKELNLDAMRKATEVFVGEHDFSAFQASNTETKTQVRTISKAFWSAGPLGLIQFEVTGNGFLKYMVRNIVGTLVDVGLGKKKAEELSTILASKDREMAGVTAPASGLFLWKVIYR